MMPVSKLQALHTYLRSLLSNAINRLLGRRALSTLLKPPEVPSALGLPDGATQVNLLHRSVLDQPLRVNIPLWENSAPPGEKETVTLRWRNNTSFSKPLTGPINQADLFIEIPPEELIEGVQRLWYEVTEWITEQVFLSEEIQVTIDKTPHTVTGAGLDFPPQVISDGVTDRWLTDNGDLVVPVRPLYQTPGAGDTLRWFWSNTVSGQELAGEKVLSLADITAGIKVTFTEDLIRSRPEGDFYAHFKVLDRAGNESADSARVPIKVSAAPIARFLPRPDVLNAPGDSLDPSDSTGGATVKIPSNAVIYPDEAVVVYWGVPDTVGAFETAAPSSSGDREYRIPAANIAPWIGKTVVVYYTVMENGVPLKSFECPLQVEKLSGMRTIQFLPLSGTGNLPLSQIAENGYATFTLLPWQFIALDQFLRVTLEGDVTINVLDAEPITTTTGVITAGRASKADLRRLGVNKIFSIKAWVSFDNKATWQPFGIARPRLIE
ncbi:hypothetical protein [Pseudomonas sp. R5(2019)]|uniref:hypothetical protein n=1 Tax=Pseudomonas sp. R5(2019) TaxID=2697566 RepID=UPI0014128A93|nr:hypothetical protein [Pseudomonas sp. R5(2019)]NBA97393.1 hypothetical protein [Pseudomonas sp. R5(2019)]